MSEFETPEFVADIGPDGSIRIPASYLERLGYRGGTRVSVRVTELSVAEVLRARGVAETEVDAIGAMQRESREDVLAFLTAEGSLAGDTDARERFGAWVRSGE